MKISIITLIIVFKMENIEFKFFKIRYIHNYLQPKIHKFPFRNFNVSVFRYGMFRKLNLSGYSENYTC